jgi:hypothetical protein
MGRILQKLKGGDLCSIGRTEIRLANCEEWSTHRSAYERGAIYAREFKAAKTNIDRLWHNLQGGKPPKLTRGDRTIMKEEVLRHLTNKK